MPITRRVNRNRPKNKDNMKERQAREAAQARWLSTGSAMTHAEILGLEEPDESVDPSADASDDES